MKVFPLSSKERSTAEMTLCVVSMINVPTGVAVTWKRMLDTSPLESKAIKGSGLVCVNDVNRPVGVEPNEKLLDESTKVLSVAKIVL